MTLEQGIYFLIALPFGVFLGAVLIWELVKDKL